MARRDAPAARDVAMVFQSYALYPHLTVRENIAVPLAMRRLPTAGRLPLVGRLFRGRPPRTWGAADGHQPALAKTTPRPSSGPVFRFAGQHKAPQVLEGLDGAKARFRAVDGTEMEAVAHSPYDVVGLAAATGAPNVQFNLALGVSSTRCHGEPMSTEIVIVIELAGEDHAGKPLRTRHAVVHPRGQMPLTGLGVAMVLERLVGRDGDPPAPAGLYSPYQLLDPAAYFARLKQIDREILTLAVA